MLQDTLTNTDDVTAPPFNATILGPANVPAHKDKFYKIVHNNVAVKIIGNSLTVNGSDDLLRDNALFSFVNASGNVEYHTATMIHIIYKNTDPTAKVRIGSILKGLENSKMSDFSNNADLLLKSMEKSFNVLKDMDRNLRTSVVSSWMLW